LAELVELVKMGYDVFCRGAMCGLIPVRKIAKGTVTITERWSFEYPKQERESCVFYLSDQCRNCGECDEWEKDEGEEIEEVQCFALDLGTSGIAGQGYDNEEHWYFSLEYEIDHENKRIIFSVPILGGFKYYDDNRYLYGYREIIYEAKLGELIIDLSEQWKPKTQCGCIC